MNQWQGIGNLTRDVELRYNGDLAIAKFTIACNEYPDEVDFIYITVFGKTAENCNKYLSKGKSVGVTGRLKTSTYEKNGEKRTSYEIRANRVDFLSPVKKEDPALDDLPF